MPTYEDAPLDVIAREVEALVAAGNEVHQKFTCAACGERVVVDEPNKIFNQGRHDDCPVTPGYVTSLEEQGCNFLLIQMQAKFVFDGESQHAG